MFGTKCKTSPIRCTKAIQAVFEDENVEIYDVFGDNDEETYHELNVLLAAKKMHKIVVAYTDSVDNVFNLARLCKALRVPLIFWRNKSEDLDEDDLQVVREHDTAQLTKIIGQDATVIIGSAKTGM